MANTQLTPTHPLESLHQEVDRLFGGFLDDFPFPKLGRRNGANMPKVDLKETDKAYELDVELPGIQPSEVHVSVADGVLTIKGEKKAEKEEKDKNYIRIERSYGSFERSFALPDNADDGAISATSKDGVLMITLPKKAIAAPEVRKVEVKPS